MNINEKISIVIPVYNTEKYLDRCLKSLTEQSYGNLEIIVVNDCSPGNADEIISRFEADDKRIVHLKHEKNKGLFRARLTGAERATGDYIAFVDSDDYVSLDFYYGLIKSAKKNNSDIVVAQTVFEKPDGCRFTKILHNNCFLFDKIEGEEIKKRFFNQRGLCYSWHTVWNKLYKKTLWDKCFPYYNTITEHLIMTEDIAFSSLMFYNARVVSAVENDAYFYCENEEASTNSKKITLKKFKKNMEDINRVFNFVDNYFNEVNAEQYVKDGFSEFRKLYSRMWRQLGETEFFGEAKKEVVSIMDSFLPDYNEYTTPDDHFFASIDTHWKGSLENIKEQVLKSECEYISFDIFDTVVLRPLYNPTDVFILMEKLFEKYVKTSMPFSKIRALAEAEARRRLYQKHPSYQDVTIEEIYDCMSDYFDFDKKVTDELMQEEKRIEISLCTQRRSAKEIYDIALISGKKVIFTSDMYLDRETIEAILDKNGYKGYYRLFLSSEERLTKNTSELFKAVLKKLETSGNNILHIGDTWQNDIVNAQGCGFKTIFFPKSTEVFENKISDMNTNDAAFIANKVISEGQNADKLKDSLATRTMLAMAANKYFDNPYRSFNSQSDFNADNYFIGYYALGMHLLGLSQWIYETAEANGYKKIDFLSRDGYLPKRIYDISADYFKAAPKSDYVYTSRKALLCGMINSKADFYDLPIEYRNHTPMSVLNLLSCCCGEYDAEKIKRDGFILDKSFSDEYEYNFFINYFIKNIYDEGKHKRAVQNAEKYYKKHISKEDVCFDLGYSGRIQAAISNVMGEGIDVLFIHNEPKRADELSRKNNFKIYNFYGYTPYMTGLIREHILSDFAPSCIGFDEDANPLLEKEEKTFQDLFTVSLMQQGAVDFAEDFVNIFKEYSDILKIRPYEVSLPFEGYLRFAKEIDRRSFAASYFEDMVYGARNKINIFDFVQRELAVLPEHNSNNNNFINRDNVYRMLVNKGVFTRAAVYLIFDRRLFKERLKYKLMKRPFLFRICSKLYRCFRR